MSRPEVTLAWPVSTTATGQGWRHEALNIGAYPAGEPMVKQTDATDARLVVTTGRLDKLMTALFYADAQAEREQRIGTLVIPYLPGARQDRMMGDGGDRLFTAKSVAKEINARGFDRVICFDPHSDVMPAMIDRCVVVDAEALFPQPLDHVVSWQGVVAPDGGAEKRAGKVARRLGVPMFRAWKTRDVRTGEITGFGCEDLPDGRFLLVDDICDGGGTFLGLAAHVAEHKRRVVLDLYVSHGVFSAPSSLPLSEAFGVVITTDSLQSAVLRMTGTEWMHGRINLYVVPIVDRLLTMDLILGRD